MDDHLLFRGTSPFPKPHSMCGSVCGGGVTLNQTLRRKLSLRGQPKRKLLKTILCFQLTVHNPVISCFGRVQSLNSLCRHLENKARRRKGGVGWSGYCGYLAKNKLGYITSCCSRNEPTLTLSGRKAGPEGAAEIEPKN